MKKGDIRLLNFTFFSWYSKGLLDLGFQFYLIISKSVNLMRSKLF